MSDDFKGIIIGLALLGIGGWMWFGHFSKENQAVVPIVPKDHYNITDTKNGLYLLDVDTGDTWRRVVLFKKDGTLQTTYWSRDMKFDNFHDEDDFVSSLKSQDHPDPTDRPNPQSTKGDQ